MAGEPRAPSTPQLASSHWFSGQDTSADPVSSSDPEDLLADPGTRPGYPKASSLTSRLPSQAVALANGESSGDEAERQNRGTPRLKKGLEDESPRQRPSGQSLSLGRQIQRMTRRPWCAFLAVQILVIWLVAVVVVYMHDMATQMRPRQKLKSSLGSQGLLEKLSQRLKERCPMQGPVCRMSSATSASLDPSQGGTGRHLAVDDFEIAELPLVIFFAGVEGSGHKFFEQVFRHLPINFSVVAFEPDLHLTAEPSQQLLYKEKVDPSCPLLPYPRPLRAFAKEIVKRLKDVGSGPYIRARDSYPLGRVRTPLARPDLLHFLELDGHVYNLKVVVLQRGLADAVRSTFRMGYHMGDIGLQARIVEDEMAFLDTSIRLLPCGKYIVLDFDWTADDPQLIAQPLAEFLDLGISAEDVVQAVKGAVQSKPKHHVSCPDFGGQPMEEFFALRTDMWPLLAAARMTPYFWPHHPRDWPEESADAPFLFERRRGYDYEG